MHEFLVAFCLSMISFAPCLVVLGGGKDEDEDAVAAA